jgi:arylsulfatase A-like enzyme
MAGRDDGARRPGASDAPVFTVDFAPALAALAQIPAPNDLDGRRLF